MLSSVDERSGVRFGGPDLPDPHLQLLPAGLLGRPAEEALRGGAGVPLETQDHQDRLTSQTQEHKEGLSPKTLKVCVFVRSRVLVHAVAS